MGVVNAGQLDTRVTLLTTSAVASDGIGGYVAGAATSYPVWAAVRQLSGREVLALGQVTNPVGYSLTIRYLPGVAATNRVVLDGVVLNIQAVQPDRRKEYLVLTCFDSGKYAPGPVVVAPTTAPRVFEPQFEPQFGNG